MSEKTKLELDLERIKKPSQKEPRQGKILKDLPLIILIMAMLTGWFLLIVEHVNHNATKSQLTAITAKYDELKSRTDNSTKDHTPVKRSH
ncbi:MAG: hypothetical protein HQK95_03975 [Nitrospirae bacterium]|nr:hypothetical protein [Nitrospirota bacterium]